MKIIFAATRASILEQVLLKLLEQDGLMTVGQMLKRSQKCAAREVNGKKTRSEYGNMMEASFFRMPRDSK